MPSRSSAVLQPNGPGPLFVYQDGRPLSRVDLVAAVREALAWMCRISMAIVFGLEPLPPQPRLATQTPSFSPWVAGSHLHS